MQLAETTQVTPTPCVPNMPEMLTIPFEDAKEYDLTSFVGMCKYWVHFCLMMTRNAGQHLEIEIREMDLPQRFAMIRKVHEENGWFDANCLRIAESTLYSSFNPTSG